MPNYIMNKIAVVDTNTLGQIKELSKDGALNIDFNDFVPRPKSLDIESGSITDQAIIYYLSNRLKTPFADVEGRIKQVINRSEMLELMFGDHDEDTYNRLKERDMDADFKQDLYDQGKIYVSNFDTYGHATWYDWSIENWGTKWNAGDASQGADEKSIYFTTAWSPSLPVTHAMSLAYPDIEFTHSWADEDRGSNTGSITIKNGRVIGEPFLPENQSQEAYQLYTDLWEQDDDTENDENFTLYH